MLESILSDLNRHLGLKAIEGTQEMKGFWLVRVPETHEVWIKDLNPGVYLRCVIAPNIGSADETFYMYLMKANFLGQGTGGGTLTLDPEEKFLTLINLIPYEVNYKIFRDKLEDFVNYIEYWQKEVKNYETRQLS